MGDAATAAAEASNSGGGGDPQRLKRIAVAAYDYESDPRWVEYWSNILIPPHMAARSDVRDHFKCKFYQCYIDPDFVVESMSSTSSSQSARASGSPSSQPANENVRSASGRASSQPASERTSPQNSGSCIGSSPPMGRNITSLRLDRRSIHFSVNAWVLVIAVLGMFPVVPRNLSNKAHRLSLLGMTCSSVYSLYTLYGRPRAWNLPAIRTWLQSIIATKDFIHLIYCLMFVTSQLHFKFALLPVSCWALEHVARFLRRNFTSSSIYRKYLAEPCLWVEANGTALSILSSHAEIGSGFLLIVSLFSWQRSIIQTFMYWQLLKLMYNAPVTAGYHHSVWAKIGRTAYPYIGRYVPFLNSPISMVQKWWFR